MHLPLELPYLPLNIVCEWVEQPLYVVQLRHRLKEPYLCVIDISQVVQSSSNADPISVFLTDLQMPPTTDHRLLKLAHHLEGVAKVARGLGLAQPISHRPGQGQVMFVIL